MSEKKAKRQPLEVGLDSLINAEKAVERPKEALNAGLALGGDPVVSDAWIDAQAHWTHFAIGIAEANYEPRRAKLDERHRVLTANRDGLESQLAGFGTKRCSWIGAGRKFATGIGAGITEIMVGAPVFGMLGIKDEFARDFATGTFVLVSSALFELARDKGNSWSARIASAGVCGWVVGSTVLVRNAFHHTIEMKRLGDLVETAAEASGPWVLLLMGGFAVALTVSCSVGISSAIDDFGVLRLRGRLERTKRSIDCTQTDIAVLAAEHRVLCEMRRRLEAVEKSSFRLGETLACFPATRVSVWSKPFQWLRSRVTRLLAVASLTMFLISCSKQHTAVGIDTSASVGLTDAQRIERIMLLAEHMPKCSELSVVPVNGLVEDPLIMDLPCNDDAGTGEIYAKRLEEFRAVLPC